ncbi:MAG: STAS domain-containing protein [Methylotenera sp.]|nr:STAS domain-containing protein [Methylotenera sp.]
MTISVLHLNDTLCRIVIDGVMTIDTEMQLQGNLLSAFATYREVDIDLAGVSEMDASTLHLLARSKVIAIARGKSLRRISPNPTVLALDI